MFELFTQFHFAQSFARAWQDLLDERKKMNYIITNGTLLLPDGESLKTEKADLYIKDGVIAAVGGDGPGKLR